MRRAKRVAWRVVLSVLETVVESASIRMPSHFFSPVGRETLKVIYYTLGGDEAQEGGAASSVRVQVQVAKVLGEVDSAKK